MPIPDYQAIMRPLLEYASDGQEHIFRDAIEDMARHFQLTEEDRKHLLPSGRQRTFDNRVGWACTYLKKAQLLEAPRRARFRITDRGRQVLQQDADQLNAKYLDRFKEFRDFTELHGQSKEATPSSEPRNVTDTPEETIEAAYQNLRDGLAAEILQSILEASPSFFERLVVDLLVKMGYGGTLKDAGQALGQSGDGGIDGIIKEDRLGLDIVYVQAKRWKPESTVGRPEIQKFAGALQGHRARKGVFITTCSFSKDAHDYAANIDTKIVLIDGDLLTQLMMDFGVGVTLLASYQVHRLDADYFSED